MKLDLQYFTGHSVTVYKDAGFSAGSASPYSSVDKDTEVTLTITPASGYELKEIEVIAGGVTVNPTTKKFAMGEADVVINLKSQKNNLYAITEDVVLNINGSKTTLGKNVKLLKTKTGAIYGVELTPTEVTAEAATVAQLVAAGIMVKV